MLHHLKRSGCLILLHWLLLLSATAQTAPPAETPLTIPRFSADEVPSDARSLGTVRILAVMVEFQEDDNRFTTGSGTFDLPFLDRDDIIIDPLPHDHGYFYAHLEFARNYFETVSGGQLTIEYDILPDIIQLEQPMSAYSPLGEEGDENYKLAHLARDAWEKAADTTIPDLIDYDPDRTMFIIFHAGSGRNIELMGTSLNKTPQDIPSVYLGTSSLQRLLEQPAFNGFDIGDPGIRVTNTALLPQTQSRPGEDFTGSEYVLQLSINGLLAANIGSFLGLPDLFNTETGASAIGRFGLMDGASIFSYLGLFPPEPSAWEKIHLGWDKPFEITLDTDEPVQLPAVSLREPNSIARHAISADEYFLVENRHRNPSGNPLEVTIRTPDGQYVTRQIDPEDQRFDPFNYSEYDEVLEPGVIVNVSNFDWSLPGGYDSGEDGDAGTDDDRLLNGGMLIWHIDEAVIRNKIGDNRVNANSDRRGVQLVEADGARDIGRTPAPGQDRFTNGHAFDFWWSGNDFMVITATGDTIIVYENRFGPDTQPPNISNNGSMSFFEFYDFSDNIPEAFFYARSVAGSYVRPVSPSFPRLPVAAGSTTAARLYPVGPEILQDASGERHLLIPSARGFYSIPLDRTDSEPQDDTGYTFLEQIFPGPPLIYGRQVIAGQLFPVGPTVPGPGDEVHVNTERASAAGAVYNTTSMSASSASDPVHTTVYSENQDIVSWSIDNGNWSEQWRVSDQPIGPGLISMENSTTIQLDQTPIRIQTDGSLLPVGSYPIQRSSDVDGLSAIIEDDRFELSDGSFHFDLDQEQRSSSRKYTGNLRFSGESGPSFFVATDRRLQIVDQADGQEWEVRTIHQGGAVSWPSFGDWSGDSSLEIFFINHNKNRIYGFNRDGAVLDHFPIPAPRGRILLGSPLLADVTGDGYLDLLTAAKDSLSITIHAYDRHHNRVNGFPLIVGSRSGGTDNRSVSPAPLLIAEGRLVAVTPAGEVRVWELPELGEVAWGRVYGSQAGNKVGKVLEQDRADRIEFGLLKKQETYNWPNPANDHTFIRFETSEPARIDITVINPGGSTVFETQAESRGRHPEEIRLNTSSWGNGVYFGRIRARNGSNSETKMIKIVITH